MKKEVWFIVIYSIFLIPDVNALGILYWHSPSVNFQPGLILNMNYVVHGIPPNQDIRLYATGDLAQYVEVTPSQLTGGGGFAVTLSLPEVIEVPGPHTIYFVASEVPGAAGGVGTSVTIRAPFTVYVPYPGKYASASLKASDINVGEPLNVVIDGTNLGTEDNSISARFEIYSLEEKVSSFDLGSVFVKSQEKFLFSKTVDTREYKSGNYKVVALVDYGSPLRLEADFRVGSLFVSITNYTSIFMKNSINRFDIEVESRWNNFIDSVYADVRVYNSSTNVTSFKTPSERLERWSKRALTGFFDTHGVSSGAYATDINLFYSSGKKSAQTLKQVNVEVIDEWWVRYKLVLVIAIVSVVFLILSISFAAYLMIKRFKMKKK